MNKGLIFVAGMGLGGAIGTAVTYYVMKKRTMRLFDEVREETIEEFKDFYDIREKYPTVDFGNGEKMATGDEVSPITTEVKTSLSGGPVDVEKTAYNKLASLYHKPDPDDISPERARFGDDPRPDPEVFMSVDDVLLEDEHPQDSGEEDIRVVDVDDFENAYDDNQVYLVWYTEDDVLTDPEGIIDDSRRELLVGDVLENSSPAEEGDIYIRNDVLDVWYDVEVVNARYEDMTG